MLLLTAVILLEPHGAGTKYTAIAIHATKRVPIAREHGLPRPLA
jgi:hypothetical protein